MLRDRGSGLGERAAGPLCGLLYSQPVRALPVGVPVGVPQSQLVARVPGTTAIVMETAMVTTIATKDNIVAVSLVMLESRLG